MQILNVREFGSITEAQAKGVVYIGRPSPLGNPYRISAELSREAAIDNYRRWLYQALTSGNKVVVAAIESLTNESVLGCWCKPQACHGDVVASAWEWWMLRGGREQWTTPSKV